LRPPLGKYRDDKNLLLVLGEYREIGLICQGKSVTRYGYLKFLNHRGFVKDARTGEAGLRGG
jgi:hypothetical protein